MPDTEEELRRKAEQEAKFNAMIAQLANAGGLDVVPGKVAPVPSRSGAVPFERDTYTPGGEYHFTRNPREYDAAAVAPMGEVPGPRGPNGEPISGEEADDQQDQLDLKALYDLQDRERAEEAKLEAQMSAEYGITPPVAAAATPPPTPRDPFDARPAAQTPTPPAAAPAAPPPQQPAPVDRFVDAFEKLRAMRESAAPVDTGAKVDPNASFSPERSMAEAGAAYDRESQRRDPINQFDQANAARTLEGGSDALDELRLDSQLGLREMRDGPRQRTPEEIGELEEKGLFTGPTENLPVASSKTPDKLPNPYGESDTRWEDEFARTHDRMSNQQIRRRLAIMGPSASEAEERAFLDRETGWQSEYDKGIAEARERDRLEQRVSREDAVALAGTGAVDAESAASLTNRSLPSRAYPNGMYAMGRNAERADKLYQQFNLGQLGENARQAQRVNAAAETTDKTVAAGLANAETYAQMRQKTERAQLSHDEHAKLFAATAQDMFQLPREVGLEAFDGDFSKVPPELMDKVENALARIKPFTAEMDMRSLGPGMAATAAKIPYSAAKVEADTIARGKADPQFAFRTQDNMLRTGMQLNQGITAWNEMSEEGKRDFAQFGNKGIGAVLANGLKDPHDRALAGAVWTVLNNLIQERSGVAVTESEWGRTASEIGLGQGLWDPFNTYEGIEHFLNNAAEVMSARHGLYARNFGWR